VDHQGKAEPVGSLKAPFFAPRISPEGQRIAYRTAGMENSVWVYDVNRRTATKLTSGGVATFLTWTPDGRRVVFGWSNSGPANSYWQSSDGGSPMERLTQSESTQCPGSWSPDGETLAFVQANPETGYDILLLNLRDHQVTPYLNSRSFEGYPEFSPDGKWIAYVSDESGRREVYVRSFPAAKGKWQISNEGGAEPLWAPNGKRLFYRSGVAEPYAPTQVWMVEVQTGSGFFAARPKLLFEQAGYGVGIPVRGWDISADGERFLMVKLEDRRPQPLTEMVLVQNWFEELRRLTSANK